MASERLRAVVVGARIGGMHAGGYARSERTELVAICDIDRDACDELAGQFDITARYTDYETMLREQRPDIVSITTPQWLHAEMTILAATEYTPRAILCEKAMASNLGEAQAMLTACDEMDVKLIIGHQGRWFPAHERARELIADGAIGTPVLATSFGGRADSGLLNVGTHTLNYLQFMLGDPTPSWVIANLQRETDRFERGWPAEELVAALIGFESGVRLSFESDVAPAAGRGYGTRIITGTEGLIILPGGEGPDLRVLRAGSGAWEEPVLGAVDSLEARTREITALAEWVNGEVAEHRQDAHLSIVTQEILMAMYESARTHTLVRLPLRTRTSPLVETLTSGDLPVRHPGRYDIRHPGTSDETPEALPPRLQIRQRATIPRAR